MNLYEIIFRHHSQKDSETGTKCLLFAKDDNAVYEWLAKEKTNWSYRETDGNYTFDGEPYKDRIIRLKGDMDDEYEEYDDLYYGKTVYGWKLLREDILGDDIKNLLLDLNIKVKEIKDSTQ